MLQKRSKYGYNYHHEKRHHTRGNILLQNSSSQGLSGVGWQDRDHPSLKTTEAVEAVALAKQRTDEWKLKFKELRNTGKIPIPSPSNTAPDIVAEFREKLTAHMEQRLPEFLGKQSDKELKDSAELYLECLFIVRNNNPAGGFDLLDELGISFPLPEQKTPGITVYQRIHGVPVSKIPF